MKKLAVIFPGIGYTVDKPLLYYSRRIAESRGYEIKLLPYSGFPPKVKGDQNRMEESYRIALAQSEEMLSDVEFAVYDDILFIGKSIGTIVAAQLAESSPLRDRIRLVLYTPLEETFQFVGLSQLCSGAAAIAFTGTADPWVGGKESRIQDLCRERGVECHVIPEANHSLESGNVLTDLRNMVSIMETTERFIRNER